MKIIKTAWDMVGIPYKTLGRSVDGLDCWGCVWLYYKEVLGTILPLHPLEPTNIIACQKTYEQQKSNYTQVTQPQDGDIITFSTRKPNYVSHVGVYVGNGLFMQSIDNVGVHILPTNHIMWRNRILGYWRPCKTEATRCKT